MSHYENVQKRIRQLRRRSWKWVKHAPSMPYTMCAIADWSASSNMLDQPTTVALNDWFVRYSEGRWGNIVEYNDSPYGAQTVDDVIAVLEKFAAEL